MVKGKPNYVIDAVIRTLDVLDAFLTSGNKPELSLAQLTIRTGMNKNATFRSLYTLVQAGFVEKDEKTGVYRLSLKLVELGRAAREGQKLPQLARPLMQELWERFQETVNLAMLHNNNELVLVEVLECPHSLRLIETPGIVQPLHATALGKAVLSVMGEQERRKMVHQHILNKFTDKTITEWSKLRRALEETQKRGWAIDDEENTLGGRCVAAPITRKNQVVGAISISGPTSRMTNEKVREMAEEIKKRCLNLSLVL
jgi:DNA-binding IclR family transcriptional regulator